MISAVTVEQKKKGIISNLRLIGAVQMLDLFLALDL